MDGVYDGAAAGTTHLELKGSIFRGSNPEMAASSLPLPSAPPGMLPQPFGLGGSRHPTHMVLSLFT